jgi:uncharacterized membrane protein YqjE
MQQLPLRDLLASISRHAGKLAELDVKLFKSEVDEISSRMIQVALYTGAALAFLFFGIGFLLETLAALLVWLGLLAWQASAIVAVMAIVLAGLLGLAARAALRARPLLPHRTMAQLREDITVLFRSFKDV